ncbi:tetratricopeptide repeat protein [Pollutibacter soli]|uniref:tetratricopeptide repeat protein n=1 Tax=Pollutibacter soli TaxID=3034157 RepID=UPI003013B2AE
MKIIIITICILSLTAGLCAQNRKIDSLDKLISKASSDTDRINLVAIKLDILSAINLDTAIQIGNDYLKLAQQIDYYKGELKLRQKLASNYAFKGQFAEASEQLDFLEKFIKPAEDSADIAALYANRGMLYGLQSKYDTSIYWYEKAIAIDEINDRYNHLGTEYSNIAIAYQQQSNYTQALFYQQKSLKKGEENKNEVSMAYTLMNIGNTYDLMGDPGRAEENILKAIDLAKKKSLVNVELYGYSNLASMYTRMAKWELVYDNGIKAATLGASMGDKGIEAASLSKAATALVMLGKYDDAIALSEKAIAIADSTGVPLNVYQAYTVRGNIFRVQGNYAKAIPFYEKAFKAMEGSDIYSKDFGIVYTEASECYEKTGNFKKALEVYKVAKQIVDSVSSKDNIRKATEQAMNFEFDKKQELLAAKQKARDEVSATKQIALAVGLALTLILAVVALAGFRNKQKANTLLQVQKNEIENTLALLKATQSKLIQSEKMASLGELTAGIAHEIENPLNFVNNFAEVSSELIDDMKAEIANKKFSEAVEIADDLKLNLQKINHHGKRADLIVKGMLQHSRSTKGDKERTNINALVNEYVKLAYHAYRAKDNAFEVKLVTNFDPAITDMEIAPQDIGRVLLNILNNSFYAVAEKKKTAAEGFQPTVSVSTRRTGQTVEIQVTDNGNGIPNEIVEKIFQPFFTTKPTGQGTGLGLSLAYDIVKAHGGEIKVNSSGNQGSSFLIILNGSL